MVPLSSCSHVESKYLLKHGATQSISFTSSNHCIRKKFYHLSIHELEKVAKGSPCFPKNTVKICKLFKNELCEVKGEVVNLSLKCVKNSENRATSLTPFVCLNLSLSVKK